MIGAQCGLTPDQVLDMNIPMLQAYIEGYGEHLFDLRCLAVQQGFWAGYYQSKKPKPTKVVLTQMVSDHEKAKKRAKYQNGNIHKPEVDVDKFLEREQKFQSRLKLRRME